MRIEIEPYLTTLDLPFGTGDISRPGARVVVVSDLGTNTFKRHCKLTGYFNFKYTVDLPGGVGKEERTYNAKTWWEDGLQSSVAHVVHILSDNPEEGIYCGFCMQNSPTHFMLLGKIKDDDEITEMFRQKFMAFMREITESKPL